MSRREKKSETRAALLEAARACFAEGGYAGTQVADIARRAGVAHGTIYVHFPDKGALVDALLDDFNRALLARVEKVWAKHDGDPPLDIARAVAATCLDHWRKEREILAAYAERVAGRPGIEALENGVSPPVAAFVEGRLGALAEHAGVGWADPELVTHALLGMWLRVGLRYLFGPKISKKIAVETLARMSIGALAAMLPATPEEPT